MESTFDRRHLQAVSLLVLLLLSAARLHAQERGARTSNVLINGAIGAAIVATRQLVGGRPVQARGILLGAAGGAIVSAGKQVAASGFDGSGVLGRQLSALGIGVISHGAGDSLAFAFPLAPLQVGIHPSSDNVVRTRLDLFDALVPLVSAASRDAAFDARASLSMGAPVFRYQGRRMPLGYHAAGLAMGGTIFVSDEVNARERRHILSHEAVHVLQWDTFRQLAAYPAERNIVSRLPGGEALARHFDIGVFAPGLVLAIVPFIPYEQQPWEREAHALTRPGLSSSFRSSSASSSVRPPRDREGRTLPPALSLEPAPPRAGMP